LFSFQDYRPKWSEAYVMPADRPLRWGDPVWLTLLVCVGVCCSLALPHGCPKLLTAWHWYLYILRWPHTAAWPCITGRTGEKIGRERSKCLWWWIKPWHGCVHGMVVMNSKQNDSEEGNQKRKEGKQNMHDMISLWSNNTHKKRARGGTSTCEKATLHARTRVHVLQQWYG